MDTKAVEKEVLDKLEKENKENDRLWAEIGVKDREIKRLQGYQSQSLDLANQVSELERSKLELEKRLKEARKTTGKPTHLSIFLSLSLSLSLSFSPAFSLYLSFLEISNDKGIQLYKPVYNL